MRTLLVIILLLITPLGYSQKIEGVFVFSRGDTSCIYLAVDNYLSITEFTKDQFLWAKGGLIKENDKSIEILYEYNSLTPFLVGEEEKFSFPEEMALVPISVEIQDGEGAWQISGRMKDGEIAEIKHSGGRKTIKLLKDGFFQWVALDTEKKEFYATGGGKYTFSNGVYTEEILFFSKDNSRVGAVLHFNGEIKENEWHHSGKSSKGDDIYEIWKR